MRPAASSSCTIGSRATGTLGTGLATVNLNGAGVALSVNQATNTTYAGVIIGAGSLTKQYTGTLTLTGVNTYTGGTMINSGSVQINNGAALGTGSVSLSGRLALNHSATTANAVSVAGSSPTLFIGTSANATTTPTLTGAITGDGAAGTLNILAYGSQAGTNNLTLSGNTIALGSNGCHLLGGGFFHLAFA